YRTANEHKIINEYVDFLSIPNVSSDRENIRRNAEFIKGIMEKRGIDARIMETGGNPVVYGEYNVRNAEQTLMFYVHYDGQPVDLTQWIDHGPFEPALRHGKLDQGTGMPKPVDYPAESQKYDPDWRIYARGASDDKAPILAILTAMDAMKEAGIQPKNNLRFIFEGEEEISSPNLRRFAENNRELFEADAFFLCDGPLHFSNKPTLDFGVRGITSVEITV
ncbi:MAG: M20/M25/M40 family metallo-hydrolase, partial [Proteobacteria bacterium]|nr:M20/M25/M40 family metallo-hydrolase [Pseudomonadota bacterium]